MHESTRSILQYVVINWTIYLNVIKVKHVPAAGRAFSKASQNKCD